MIDFRWAEDTAHDPAKWTRERPMTGHCAIAALIINDVYGGTIWRCLTADGSHYFNRLPSGALYDATAGQFYGAPDYGAAQERTREYLLADEWTRDRYKLLRTRSLGEAK